MHRYQPEILSTRLVLLCLTLVLAACAQAASAQAPRLVEIALGDGKLYLLGGTPLPPDSDWLADNVRAAIAASDALVVDIPAADSAAGVPPFRRDIYPSADMHPVAIEEGYGNLAFGDYMDVSMGERSVVESQRLDLNGNWYRPMQPWVAYFYFSYSFWDKAGLDLADPETRLVRLFRDAGKPVNALFADRAAVFRFFGAMSDVTQTQLFQSLYSIMDWQRGGEYSAQYAWTVGAPDSRFLDRHRRQTPRFYEYYYASRNRTIAAQVLAMLEAGGTMFLYLDVNRTLGPDSVQSQLADLGATVTPPAR